MKKTLIAVSTAVVVALAASRFVHGATAMHSKCAEKCGPCRGPDGIPDEATEAPDPETRTTGCG
jgi:hypothetical protein